MIVFRAFTALALSISAASCADPIKRLCQADIREQLINADTVEFSEFSSVSYDDKINEMLESALNSQPPIPVELRTAYRSDFQQRARRMSLAWAKLEMSFHRYKIVAQGRSGANVTATLDCAAAPTVCRCRSRAVHEELYRS